MSLVGSYLGSWISNDYLRAVVVFVVLLILIRFVLMGLQRFLMALTSKTKTDVDDILVKRSSSPLTLIAVLLAVRLSLGELVLSEVFEANSIAVVYSAIVAVIGYLVYVFVDTALIRGWKKVAAKSRARIDESLANLVHEVLRIVIIVLVLLYVLDMWGIEILPILGALGVAGIAVALALQPTLSNIFSGVAMILDKSIRVGDWVVLDDGTWGVVQKVGIRSTKLKSFDNELVVLPNTKLADSKIQNVSMPEPLARAVVPFSVAYGSDIDKVKKIVLAELKKISGVVSDPECSVKFLEMGDSALKFKAYFYVERFDTRLSAIDEANTRIYNALNKNGIEIPFPQLDVRVKK